jgi:hypothetical protein
LRTRAERYCDCPDWRSIITAEEFVFAYENGAPMLTSLPNEQARQMVLEQLIEKQP